MTDDRTSEEQPEQPEQPEPPESDETTGDPAGGFDLGALLGGGPGGLDLGALMGQAAQMQQQLAAAQEEAEREAAATVVTGSAGGGAVTVEVTGSLDFQSVTIRPDAVDPDDVEMLQDLVLAALHDAITQVRDVQRELLGGAGEVPGLPDLDSIGDLLGGTG